MTTRHVYISGIGIISSLGSGLEATEESLARNQSAIRPLTLFPLLQGEPLPVGQVTDFDLQTDLPRTHQLALTAAEQSMSASQGSLEAIIVGTTTGGISRTEELLRENDRQKSSYRYHGLSTVAEELARNFKCSGPALTISTACSSGTVAIALAMRLLQRGEMECVLAGGVDSLCRLTYFGFHSLQLVDHRGCMPLDVSRQGMSVAEGAAMLLLTTKRPRHHFGELLGAGFSCDAYHPAAPHPDGQGAFSAMQSALRDAGILPADVGYLSLHGTGTPDNDLSESKAVHRLFSDPPFLSSIKGATGHTLAASGAIEAAVAATTVTNGLLPANTGCQTPDPALDLQPITEPFNQATSIVLSNSFGFGGNNGCLVIGDPSTLRAQVKPRQFNHKHLFAIHGSSCLSGSGDQSATLSQLLIGTPVAGLPELESIPPKPPQKFIRRLKRLPRMALTLALAAYQHSGMNLTPTNIFMGTGWGALSETYDFLNRLAESDEQFPSPTDFVGSVHNAAASQIAIMFGATGANITTSGGDYSFEQALLAADLVLNDPGESALVLGVDEAHETLSPLFDPSIASDTQLSDGGGAFIIDRNIENARYSVTVPFYMDGAFAEIFPALEAWYGGKQKLQDRCGVILAGIPSFSRREGERQLAQLLEQTKITIPVIRYRPLLGEFTSASSVAAVAATLLLENGSVPKKLTKNETIPLDRKTILVLGLGTHVTAMEFTRL